VFPSPHFSPGPKRSSFSAGDRVLLAGRFASGSRAIWSARFAALGMILERQISTETAWVVVGESGWPLRRNGQLPRDLVIAQALATHSQRPVILGETEYLHRLRCEGARPEVSPDLAGVGDDRDRTLAVGGSVVDLLRQRDLVRLISSGVPIPRLRRALAQLRRWFPEAVSASLAMRDCTGVVGIRTTGGWMTPNGQRLFDFASSDQLDRDGEGHGTDEEIPVIFTVKDATQPGREPAGDLFDLAVAKECDGDLPQAESLYRQLLRGEGPDADVCYNLANVLAAMGQVEAALERLSQAVELRPRFSEAWYNQGVLSQRIGKSTRAQDCFREALRHW
jgi:hypothetical protein